VWWEDKLCEVPVAQIRGRFINWKLEVCESVWWEDKLCEVPVAQIRGGFINWKWIVQFIFHYVKYKLKRYKSLRDLYLFAKVCGGRINCGARLVLFTKKQSIYIS
jgi:hypothetical protein